jgi:hypothetical protein
MNMNRNFAFFLFLLIIEVLNSSVVYAKNKHPIFDRCGTYEVYGVIHCDQKNATLIQNFGTDSAIQIRIPPSPLACDFYQNYPIRFNIQIRSLNISSEAQIIEKTLHRVLPESLIIPPQLKKESPCE